MTDPRDRDLGLDRPITRRDFLQGVALATAGLLAPKHLLGAAYPWPVPGDDRARRRSDYPPALMGLRGSHDGSFEAAHALRDGSFWSRAGAVEETGETYDLVVVGAGLSGLAAAHFFRKQAGTKARILLLDNHDDFGGHAKRNEFRVGGRLLIGYGGSFAIDSPAPWSPVAGGLLRELGIDVSRGARVLDRKLYPSLGLGRGLFFDKETFGVDRLVPDPFMPGWGEEGGIEPGRDPWPRFLALAPIPEAARNDLRRLARETADYLPGLGSDDKKRKLARMSYADFLTKIAKVHPDAVRVLQARTHPLYGVGVDAVPAQDAWGLDLPGFQGMGLDPKPGRGMNLDAIPHEEAKSFFFHYPDGNASIARLLVRKSIPAAVPGRDADDVLTARVDYGRLDETGWPVRLRLNSTVVRVRHMGPPAGGGEVEVAYARHGRFQSVRARHCILACWSGIIPYLCPELPEAQREALAYEVKVPIVYTNVVLRSWTAFQKLGVFAIHAPGGYHSGTNLALPVSLGGYRCSRTPEEPIVVHMMRTPCGPGLSARDQHKLGRVELLATTFETFEREIRSQLARMLGDGGFDPARDILAITVNRWPHGYAYQYNSLFDPFWLEGGEPPCVRARKPFGRIAIANADAAAYSYADAAIDQAHRAVAEVMAV